MGEIKKIAKNFTIYATPDIVSILMPFIILPITTAYLTLNDFGNLALFNLCAVPFVCLSEFGAGYVIFSTWFRYDKRQKRELLFNLLLISFAIHLIAILIIGTAYKHIFPLIAGKSWENIKDLFLLIILMAFFQIPSAIFSSWIIIEQRAVLSSSVQFANIILSATAMVVITVLTQNYRYIIMGSVAVTGLFFLVKLTVLALNARPRLRGEYFKLTYKIGSPMFFRSVFNQIQKYFDKFYVINLYGGAQFALYNWSSQLNRMFETIGRNFDKSMNPVLYEGLAANKVDLNSFRKILFGWFYITFSLCFLLFVFGEKGIELITHGVFSDAYPLFLLFSCVLLASSPFLANSAVIVFNQKTRYLFICTVIRGVLTLIGCIVLIPRFGPKGGIISLWLGTVVGFTLYFIKKRRLFPQFFIEKTVFIYVILYHILVIMKVFWGTNFLFLPISFLFGALTFHFYVIWKEHFVSLFKKSIHHSPMESRVS